MSSSIVTPRPVVSCRPPIRHARSLSPRSVMTFSSSYYIPIEEDEDSSQHQHSSQFACHSSSSSSSSRSREHSDYKTNLPSLSFATSNHNHVNKGGSYSLPFHSSSGGVKNNNKRKLFSYEPSATTTTTSMNLTSPRSLASTREGIRRAETGEIVEELWLGPVFESSQTVLSAISSLPKTVTHLDLDLRNALHLLPQALPLLFSKHHLKSLSVRVFGDTGAIELSKWMNTNPNLERLDLRGNRIGSLGARTIIDTIIAASSNQQHELSHLNLSCNCILHGDLIGQLLASTTTSIQTLDLSFNWLGNQEVDDICMGLRNNKSLKVLNLFGCHRINHDGMKTLLHCVQHYNTSIHTINLQTFDDEGKHLVNEINYWLKLNKAGRYLIKEEDSFLPSSSSSSSSLSSSENEHQEQVQRSCISSTNSNRKKGVPSGLWPLALAKTNQDPDSIFYLVREGISPRVFQQQQRHR